MPCRSIAVTLVAVLLLTGSACHVEKKVWRPSTSVLQPEKTIVLGVTTRDGRDVRFDGPGRVEKDTLQARVADEPFQIPLSDVQRYWVLTRGISTARTVGLVAGVTAGAVVVVLAVRTLSGVAASSKGDLGKGCCLFVYSWDGSQYVFDTEAYTSAITRGLERDDYSLLAYLREQEGEYRLLFSNDMDETQYTNFAELWVVDHAPGTYPRAGQDGRLYSIREPIPPLAARDAEGADLRRWLERTDRLIWEPEPAAERREIVLTFPRPPGARQAKLLASATHTLWAGRMAGEMLSLQGRELPAWYRQIDENPAARDELLAWMAREELFALQVQVEEPTGWEVRGMLPVGGPFVSDERVLPLDISRVPGAELRIRIRPPAGFWAFNSFAVDYSPQQPLSVSQVAPNTARDEQGSDLLPALAAVDEQYQQMSAVGEKAWVSFPAPPRRPGLERTVFLHTRGYYRMHLPDQREPDRATFETILREPGAGARLSALRYALK